MANARIDIDAFLNDTEVSRAANRIQVEMDRISTISEKTGLSTTAINKALKEQEKVTKSTSMSWTDFRSAYQVAMDVVRVGEQVWGATVEKAQEYDQSIRDIMLSTGATAEESSRLVQVVDDAGVSYGTLKTALKMASKDGIEPNIESIKKLSDEYLKLSPGVERNQFLLDKFGKSGLEMARVMELGGDAIAKMNAEIDGGLVLTQEAIDQSEEYRKNIDQMQDSWDSLVVTVGNKVIPVTNDLIEHYKLVAQSLEENGYWYTLTHQFSLEEIEDDKKRAAATDSATTSYTAWAEAISGQVIPAEEENKAAIEALTQANQDHLDLVGSLSKEYENHSEKLQNIKDENAKLTEEKQKLLEQGYWPESEAIQNINEKIAENETKYNDATAEFELNSRRRILSMLEEQLSMDGLSQQESEYLLAKGLAWGVYSEEAVAAAKEAMAEVLALTDAINAIPSSKEFTLMVNQAGATDANFGGSGASRVAGRRAKGGDVTAGQTYLVGEQGMELFTPKQSGTITPNDKIGSGIDTDRIVAAIFAAKTDESKLARLIIEGALEKSR